MKINQDNLADFEKCVEREIFVNEERSPEHKYMACCSTGINSRLYVSLHVDEKGNYATYVSPNEKKAIKTEDLFYLSRKVKALAERLDFKLWLIMDCDNRNDLVAVLYE